jgi:hypothetical protein
MIDNQGMTSMEPNNPRVTLAIGNFRNNVPAIWPLLAEGSARTLDIIVWQTLEAPT